ncbi:MAG TPA: glycine--tRNA ligase subunit beta, partial [Sphingomicrobium sp.]|nr:glycine--tRNA ligase subunit beta [Sphingomicrobium sp.]
VKVPLEEQAKKLGGIVFHEKLGTVADKVERVAKLARWLVEEGIVKGASADDAERAARLAKADLVTGMVGEFPELQGVIGGYLARAQGEPDAVADAVRDHYKPVGQGDDVPTAPVTVAVSLADKLDTVVSFFAAEMFPTGSKDPFALRRAMLGIQQMAAVSSLRFPLRRAAEVAFENLARREENGEYWLWGYKPFSREEKRRIVESGGNPDGSSWAPQTRIFLGETLVRVLEFFADRLKVQQREAGVRHDLIDAVFALGGEDDLVRLLARVGALQAFVETGEGANLLAGYKRAANILKKEKWDSAAASDADVAPEEAVLRESIDTAETNARSSVEAEDFTAAMAALASLRAPIDAFFDKVTVNADDAAVRARRLSLLARFRDAVHSVADFSKIEG